MSLYRKLTGSLYLQLLAIYGLTFVLIMVAIGAGFRIARDDEHRGYWKRNLERYAQSLIKEIGVPPDPEKLAQVRRETGLGILVESSANNEAAPVSRWRDDYRRGFQISQGGYTFYFLPFEPGGEKASRLSIGLFAALTGAALALLISYRLTRRAFAPLDEMKSAAQAFGDGKWQARVPLSRARELNELSETMNQMADKISLQMKSMRELLIAISHEIRSPLARMRLSLEFVSEEKVRKQIDEEIVLLDRITGALIERERLESRPDLLKKDRLNISQLLESVLSGYRDKGGVVLEDSLAGDAWIQGDAMRLSLAIGSLIENALTHGKGRDGISRISVKSEVLNGDTGMVRVTLHDSGPGLTEDIVKNLGQPFYLSEKSRTGERSRGGFGLGLSLASSVFKAHGAKFEAQNSSNGGAQFTITFVKA